MFGLFLEAMVDCLEDACFEYLGIIGDHERDLANFVLIFCLVDLDLMEDV